MSRYRQYCTIVWENNLSAASMYLFLKKEPWHRQTRPGQKYKVINQNWTDLVQKTKFRQPLLAKYLVTTCNHHIFLYLELCAAIFTSPRSSLTKPNPWTFRYLSSLKKAKKPVLKLLFSFVCIKERDEMKAIPHRESHSDEGILLY